ncbi:MAG: hypothetical protein IPH86_17640 [bacterium]|nr:hypothetical protein [bacterium]
MKRCLRLFLPIVLAALAGPAAFAGLDPDRDSMGIYFDTAGNINCAPLSPFTPQNAYLLLAHPSATTGGFACRVSMVGVPHFVLSTDLGGNMDLDPSLEGFQVGASAPYSVVGGYIVLATFQIMLQSPGQFAFYIRPPVPPYMNCAGPIVWSVDGTIRCCGVSSGNVDIPVAGWNMATCPVADESLSFGAIKGLYR